MKSLLRKFDEATKSMKSSKAKVKNNTSMDLAGKRQVQVWIWM